MWCEQGLCNVSRVQKRAPQTAGPACLCSLARTQTRLCNVSRVQKRAPQTAGPACLCPLARTQTRACCRQCLCASWKSPASSCLGTGWPKGALQAAENTNINAVVYAHADLIGCRQCKYKNMIVQRRVHDLYKQMQTQGYDCAKTSA